MVHECVNSICQLVNNSAPEPKPTAINDNPSLNSNSSRANLTSGSIQNGDRESSAGGGWDSWRLVEKVGLILGIVSGTASIGALFWCRKVRRRNNATVPSKEF